MNEKDLADIQESLDFALERVRYGYPLHLSTEKFLKHDVPALIAEVIRLRDALKEPWHVNESRLTSNPLQENEPFSVCDP